MIENEQKLIEEAVEGGREAFGALYDFYHTRIYRYVFVKVSRKEEAEDLTHQVFLSAWQSIRRYKHQGYPFSGWLYEIARNKVIDFYRSHKTELSIDLVGEHLTDEGSAVTALAGMMERDAVIAAVRNLKPLYQDVILLRFVDDLSLKETAKIVGKSEGAIKVIQHRAIQDLKNTLRTEEA